MKVEIQPEKGDMKMKEMLEKIKKQIKKHFKNH